MRVKNQPLNKKTETVKYHEMNLTLLPFKNWSRNKTTFYKLLNNNVVNKSIKTLISQYSFHGNKQLLAFTSLLQV